MCENTLLRVRDAVQRTVCMGTWNQDFISNRNSVCVFTSISFLFECMCENTYCVYGTWNQDFISDSRVSTISRRRNFAFSLSPRTRTVRSVGKRRNVNKNINEKWSKNRQKSKRVILTKNAYKDAQKIDVLFVHTHTYVHTSQLPKELYMRTYIITNIPLVSALT